MSAASSSSPGRRRLTPAAAALLALLLVAVAVGCGDGAVRPAESAAARVNGRDIPSSTVAAIRAESRLLGNEIDEQEALDQAIERELVRGEAERLGVRVQPGAVDDRLGAVAEELGGDAALDAALEGARLTRAQLRSGLGAAELFAAVGRAKFAGLRADVADARRFYERRRDGFTTAASVDLGAIFVRNQGIAGNALDRLEAGRPFEEVSRQFSIDPQLKDSLGRLGWIDPRSLPGDLHAAVEKLRPGQMSAPVAGGGGVWIFKVFDRKAESVVPFADVRDDIVRLLTARQRAKALQQWLEDTKDGASGAAP